MDVENDEWMLTISEDDQVLFALAKEIHSYVFLFCIDDNVET